MTLSSQTAGINAASITDSRLRSRNRHKTRQTRDTNEPSTGLDLGERNCTEQQKREKGCLAGSCVATIGSSVHTYVSCRCPANRQGARCEEVAINTDRIADFLRNITNEDLCKQGNLELLALQIGIDDQVLHDCELLRPTWNQKEPDSTTPVLTKMDKKRIREEERQKKKAERDKRRQRKLRKREKKRKRREREKKRHSKLDASYTDQSEVINDRDTRHLAANLNLNIFISETELKPEKDKDHSGHSHKVRHGSDKSVSRHRRKLSSDSLSSEKRNNDYTGSSISTQSVSHTQDKRSKRSILLPKTTLYEGIRKPILTRPQSYWKLISK